jgi:hypothetical protein
MIHTYFYNLDEIHDDFNLQETITSFLESCKDTLWAMGEAMWLVDDDP